MRFLLTLVLLLSLTACTDDGDWWSSPPDGTRWVGYDGAVVAVPDWWTTGETTCGAPVEDTVYFDSGAVVDCADPDYDATVDEVSSLAVLHHDGGIDEDDLDGSCQEWFRGVCRRMFAVPGSDAVFAVTIDEEGDGDFEEIRDSARALPDRVTTVPLAIGGAGGWTPTWGAEPTVVRDLRRAIEAAGLEVEVQVLDPDPNGDVADLAPGSLLEVQPALGAPVESGSTVKVTVMGTSGP
ncbi:MULTISPECIES: PASTA domain-containing protein [unclassified Nocardioides]|uniref:PASTA domain-containing protein n=1 Tax=Nocardioides sp. URHA0032 TaxID=1380388 RepID=UPI00048CF855|nr:PASTA domain-containing protein [Nocardioides sp. URHA0032]